MNIPVTDPFGVDQDTEMPVLRLSLDPALVQAQFNRRLPRLTGGGRGTVQLKAIRVTRHKPGRRCVVEYDLDLKQSGSAEALTLVGKSRARRFGRADFRLLDALWNAGFEANSPDGVSVPEPIGVVSLFRMWFQRKVPGQSGAAALLGPDGSSVAGRVAEAAHKLHVSGVPARRAHTLSDELGILHRHVPMVGRLRPGLQRRLDRLLAACDALAASLPREPACGIHRDFYPEQLVVDRQRLWLLDFDLYSQGDPAVDIGNFLGHITEESLRTRGNPRALADREQALEERFLQLAGEGRRAAVRAYATLTLVRHVYLSSQRPGAGGLTRSLMELCEERLGLPGRPALHQESCDYE